MTVAGQFSLDPDGQARIAGELTLDTVSTVFRQAEIAATQGRQIADVDLAAVSRVDSSGLALLLEWQSLAHRNGRIMRIRNAPPGLLSLTRLCEASDLMVFEGRAAAVSPGKNNFVVTPGNPQEKTSDSNP
jgi:phospholipid transport system transporter-binding protein